MLLKGLLKRLRFTFHNFQSTFKEICCKNMSVSVIGALVSNEKLKLEMKCDDGELQDENLFIRHDLKFVNRKYILTNTWEYEGPLYLTSSIKKNHTSRSIITCCFCPTFL